jgi:hypothetical protein
MRDDDLPRSLESHEAAIGRQREAIAARRVERRVPGRAAGAQDQCIARRGLDGDLALDEARGTGGAGAASASQSTVCTTSSTSPESPRRRTKARKRLSVLGAAT